MMRSHKNIQELELELGQDYMEAHILGQDYMEAHILEVAMAGCGDRYTLKCAYSGNLH